MNKRDMNYPIPDRTNFVLTIFLVLGTSFLLIKGGRMHEFNLEFIALAMGFAFLMTPHYSLIHEMAHCIGLSNKKLNYISGVVLSIIFFGSFTFIQKAHMNHHKNNRTDVELTDLYYDYRKRLKKSIYYFGINIGFKWLGIALATLAFFLPKKWLVRVIGNHSDVGIYIDGTHQTDAMFRKIRIESLFVLVCHALIVNFFRLDLFSYATIYLIHGFVWSSQNYISHAFSPRSIIHGAHNHKMNPIIQLFYLNFNFHLAHHENPTIPWLYLPKFLKGPSRMSYLRAYIGLWKGPLYIRETDPIEFRQVVK